MFVFGGVHVGAEGFRRAPELRLESQVSII